MQAVEEVCRASPVSATEHPRPLHLTCPFRAFHIFLPSLVDGPSRGNMAPKIARAWLSCIPACLHSCDRGHWPKNSGVAASCQPAWLIQLSNQLSRIIVAKDAIRLLRNKPLAPGSSNAHSPAAVHSIAGLYHIGFSGTLCLPHSMAGQFQDLRTCRVCVVWPKVRLNQRYSIWIPKVCLDVIRCTVGSLSP
jgi:hypothetical protein